MNCTSIKLASGFKYCCEDSETASHTNSKDKAYQVKVTLKSNIIVLLKQLRLKFMLVVVFNAGNSKTCLSSILFELNTKKYVTAIRFIKILKTIVLLMTLS